MIQLLILCKTVDYKKYGPQPFLQNLINDLQDLHENCLTVSFEGKNWTFEVNLSVLIADNLGAHTLRGFLESFSAIRMCRFYMAKKHDIGHKFCHEDCVENANCL